MVSERASHEEARSELPACKTMVNDYGVEAPVGIEPTNRGFADLCLTTWLRRRRDPKIAPRREAQQAAANAALYALAHPPDRAQLRGGSSTRRRSTMEGTIREARLRPQYASLYPALEPGTWQAGDRDRPPAPAVAPDRARPARGRAPDERRALRIPRRHQARHSRRPERAPARPIAPGPDSASPVVTLSAAKGAMLDMAPFAALRVTRHAAPTAPGSAARARAVS